MGHPLEDRAGDDLIGQNQEAAGTERAPGLMLAGNSVDGIGVEQVIARGREVARALLESAPA